MVHFNQSEAKLLELIIKRRQIKLRKVESRIKELKDTLAPLANTNEYIDKCKMVQGYISKVDKETKNKKVKKHQRDVEDYKNKMYKWQEFLPSEGYESKDSTPEREVGNKDNFKNIDIPKLTPKKKN